MNEDRARKVRLRALRFQLKEGKLYKRSYRGALLKCVNKQEVGEVMDEVHVGTCSAHHGADALYQTILLRGYYWLSMRVNCKGKVRACKVCQVFAKLAKWRIDLIGQFPMTYGQCKFMIVAIDYFTKWIEVEGLATITA